MHSYQMTLMKLLPKAVVLLKMSSQVTTLAHKLSLTSAQVRMELVKLLTRAMLLSAKAVNSLTKFFPLIMILEIMPAKAVKKYAELTAAIENGLLDKHISF